MGNFAENLNLGNRFRPPLSQICYWQSAPPPLTAKNLPKIGKKREKIRKKREREEKSGKRGKIVKVLSLCPCWQIGLATLLPRKCLHFYDLLYLLFVMSRCALKNVYISITHEHVYQQRSYVTMETDQNCSKTEILGLVKLDRLHKLITNMSDMFILAQTTCVNGPDHMIQDHDLEV